MEGQGLGGDEAPIQYSVGMKQDRGTSEHLTQLFTCELSYNYSRNISHTTIQGTSHTTIQGTTEHRSLLLCYVIVICDVM